jgi:hypothetical protein
MEAEMSLIDEVAKFVGSFVTSARHHVVEDGWFGKVVTPELGNDATAGLDQAFGLDPPSGHSLDIHGNSSRAPNSPTQSFTEQLGWERPSGHDAAELGIER